MTLSLPTASSRPVRIIQADEIASVADFYGRFAHEPLIVRGLYPPDHPTRGISLEGFETLLGNVGLQVYDAATQDYNEIRAAQIFAGVRESVTNYNVVDHHIVGTPLGDLCEPPAFLRCNWFIGPPADYDEMEKSVVLSPAGSFTPLHLDAYGMQGWMYLIEGRKTWELIPPDYLLAAFDPIRKEFFDPRQHSTAQFPLLRHAEKYVGMIVGGDLLYFPAGWIHQVETHEASYGFGGSLINDYQIEAHMRWWLWERTLCLDDGLDLKRVLEAMPQERFSGAQGRARVAAALSYCDSWETRMKKLAKETTHS